MVSCTALVLAGSMVLGQADGEEVFKSYIDLALGGVWTATVDNEQLEASYKRVANDQFVQLTSKGGIVSFVAMIGVDPSSKKCNWWIFYEDGTVGKSVMTQEADGVWKLDLKGVGPKGKTRYKGTLTRVDADTIKEEQISVMVNGEKQEPQTSTWTRKR
jgi:hypothetical protein